MVSLVQEIKAYGIGSIKKGERNWWGNTESLIKFSSFYRWRSSKELVWEILLRYDDNTSTLIYSSHFVFLIGLVLCVIFQFFQIEAASKYSTVDTLKQQYRFVPSKHKVCSVSIVWHYFIWYCKRKTKFISKYVLLMFVTDTMEIQLICMLIMEFVLANIFIQGRILSVCIRL